MGKDLSREKALDNFAVLMLAIGIIAFLFYLISGLIFDTGGILIAQGFIWLIISLGVLFLFRVISEISRTLKLSQLPEEENQSEDITDDENGFKIGSLVVNIQNKKQMRIREINPDTKKYCCYSNGGVSYEGDFDKSEIRLFN